MISNKKIVGITCSTFDLLHAGHVLMLEECKKYCDYLICAIQIDPTIDRVEKNKPVQNIVERFIQLDAVKYVDKIIPYNTESDLEDIFKSLDINIRIIGSDYLEKDFTAKQICKDRNIQIIYNKRDHNFSTTKLRKKIHNIENNL
jgi:glycerol-3-phosphate cytidylyltransferase